MDEKQMLNGLEVMLPRIDKKLAARVRANMNNETSIPTISVEPFVQLKEPKEVI